MVAFVVLLLTACSPTVPDDHEEPPVPDEADAGSTVTLHGTAMDAHAGAVLVRDGERDVYIVGLDYWPKEARGRQVEVSGTLTSRSLAPEPQVTPEGIVSHGMAGGGDRLVLEDATWRVLDDPDDSGETSTG